VIRQLPNLITGLRFVLLPVVWWYIWQREYEIALLFGFIASASDAIDGWLARKLHAESRFGAIADPIADKLLLSGSYATFWLAREIPAWICAVVIGRDLLILLVAGLVWRFSEVRDFPPSVWGKFSTFVQIMTGLVILVRRSLASDIYFYHAEQWVLWICAAVTVWSGIHYAWVVYARLFGAKS
jgi:cardiolipin synthase (CMP-forming)